jgi:hypothetical protein
VPTELTDHYIDLREANRVAHKIYHACEGEEKSVVVAAMIAQLVTTLVGPMSWDFNIFAKMVSEVAQCIQMMVWTVGKDKQ